MKKLAFCFLCKQGINNMPLWKKFFQGNESRYNIYFHCSSSHSRIREKIILDNIVPQQKTSWGDIYKAITSIYSLAIKDDNYKYILLSESCIPVKSFNYIYNYLIKDDLSYLCFQNQIAKNLYERNTLIQSYERYIANSKRAVKFLYYIDIKNWFYHETWTILNKDHAQLIMNNNLIIESFRDMKCFAHDENIVAYILNINNQLKNVKSVKTTFTNWIDSKKDNGRIHPKLYNKVEKKDIDMFKPYLFARKFSEIDKIEKIIKLDD